MNCRDWQDTKAFLEIISCIAGLGPEARARKVHTLEA